jgi:hypothetical protein
MAMSHRRQQPRNINLPRREYEKSLSSHRCHLSSSRGVVPGGARRRSRESKLPLEKILLALGSTKIFGISPIGLGGEVAGTGLPEQRDGLVVEGFDA